MSQAIPLSARKILERGVLAYVAVNTVSGPHVTPMVYVLDGGRLWVSTSRGSVKARSWRRDGSVAGMVRAGGAWVTFRGRARSYDALDPISWPAAIAAGPRITRAAARFSLKNARFFAGYAADARRIPLAWTPPARVFAGIELTSGRAVDGEGVVAGAWGHWPTGVEFRASFGRLPQGRALDLRAPPDVRRAVGPSGRGALGLLGGGSLTVLPAWWRRIPREGAYEAILARSTLELGCAFPGVPAGLVVDRASAWRASDMAGMLLQATADLFSSRATRRGSRSLSDRLDDVDGPVVPDPALVRIRPERVVWWRGWTSGAVARRRLGGRR